MSRDNVARFLTESTPLQGSWKEKRLAFRIGDNVYLISDNIPGWNTHDPNEKPYSGGIGWTTSQILDWLKSVGIKPFELEVEVTPIAEVVKP